VRGFEVMAMDEFERLVADLLGGKVDDQGLSATPPTRVLLRRIRWRQALAAATATVVVAGVAFGSVVGIKGMLRAGPRPAIQRTSAPAPTPTTSRSGGSITVGTREMPECLNPITSCAAAVGAWWTVLEQVLPRAMELDAKGDFVASPLLVDAPSLENGGITTDPFSVTYLLNPEANWADGTPITSADFDFTWRAIMNTTGTYSTAGYGLIDSIDVTAPKEVVIFFRSVYVDWPDLFGGAYSGLLEAAAFPQYANDPTPDLANEMRTSIPFSGGPWVLDSFTNPGNVVLVRNERYFGRVPLLDQVTFVPLTLGSTSVAALKSGSIDAFPWPAEAGLLDSLSGDPDVRAVAGTGFGPESLWFNHSRAPLDDPMVREALMYAIDRQAVVDQVISTIDPEAQVLNCGLLIVPGMGPWCETTPFDQFIYDPERAKQILESDGYDCSDVPCTKGGQNLTVEYSTVSTNDVRVQVQQLLVRRALPAGFELVVSNYDAGTLFGDVAPHGGFTMAEYEDSVSVDPSATHSLSCENIPTERNGFDGANWSHWCDQAAAELMRQSDQELDPAKRLQEMEQLFALEVADAVSLPLFAWPDLAAWRTDRIVGPVGEYLDLPYGLFFNMNEWSLA
jgi:peptide/nickel transport system substrate-binding protein